MSTNQPIPIPTSGDIRKWAGDLVSYLRVLEGNVEVPGPKIVQLEHKKTTAKATQDGILMYDPVVGQMVISKNGAWHTIMMTP